MDVGMLLGVLACLISAVCVLLVRSSTPAQLVRGFNEIREVVRGSSNSFEDIRLEWARERRDLDSALESIEASFEKTESKRRSAAAKLSALNRAEGNAGGGFDLTSQAGLAAAARAQGLGDV